MADLSCPGDADQPPADPGGGGGGVPEGLPSAADASSGSSTSSSSSSGSSSGSEANKENASPKAGGGRAGLTRRQRKNRSRREDSSPPVLGAAPAPGPGVPASAAARKARGKARRQAERGTPLRQHTKLNLSDYHLQAFMRHYLLGPEQLLGLGFPVESSLWPGRAIIYKAPGASRVGGDPDPDPSPTPTPASTNFDVNAREFVPGARPCSVLVEANAKATQVPPARRLEDLPAGMDYNAIGAEWAARHVDDSGSGDSQDSIPSPSSSSDVVEDVPEVTSLLMPTAAVFRPANAMTEDQRPLSESQERKCVRCGRGFFVTDDGEYLTQERCVYHWGKLQAVGRGLSEFTCCKGLATTRGCCTARLHVWLGVREGVNGPLDGYVRTRPRKTPPPDGNFGVYALDCEMCFTTLGLELAKVTVVAADGRLVYDCLVKPDSYIVDYNTRFSGITARDLARKGSWKSLKEVQNDLMGFINSDTVLVGHGLENDLRALRIIHGTVVDTSVVFPHYYGLPYRRSLKSLVGCLLKRDIQKSPCGHDSFEDARACIELMLWRVRKDFRGVLGK